MEAKNFLKSKTIIGLLVAAAPALAGIFGFNIDAETAKGLGEHLGAAATHIDGLIQIGGLLLAAYGRIKATKPLTIK